MLLRSRYSSSALNRKGCGQASYTKQSRSSMASHNFVIQRCVHTWYVPSLRNCSGTCPQGISPSPAARCKKARHRVTNVAHAGAFRPLRYNAESCKHFYEKRACGMWKRHAFESHAWFGSHAFRHGTCYTLLESFSTTLKPKY